MVDEEEKDEKKEKGRRRLERKRARYLRLASPRSSAPSHLSPPRSSAPGPRQAREVTGSRDCARAGSNHRTDTATEAAATLRTISASFLRSLKYKQVSTQVKPTLTYIHLFQVVDCRDEVLALQAVDGLVGMPSEVEIPTRAVGMLALATRRLQPSLQ